MGNAAEMRGDLFNHVSVDYYSLPICWLQALELDDVVRRCGARNREVLTIARPGEVKNGAVAGEVRKLTLPYSRTREGRAAAAKGAGEALGR